MKKLNTSKKFFLLSIYLTFLLLTGVHKPICASEQETEEHIITIKRAPQVEEPESFDTLSPYAQPEMPFRIGFEFQEINGLCPWALNNNNIQKKPLFIIQDNQEKRDLWHVVIDTSDIELVANHFSYKEKHLLENCLDTLLTSFYSLYDLIKEHRNITFKEWTDSIDGILDKRFSIVYNDLYSLNVRDRTIESPFEEWIPKFAPQVTLQHPLEYTIPLYFGLFGFNSSYMMPFSASLPFKTSFLETQQNADGNNFSQFVSGYKKKMNGLVFLHALTLVQMTSDSELSDEEALKITEDFLTKTHQVDAKMMLTLMSRRPFSSMFEDIGTTGSYHEYFKLAMSFNSSFMNIYKVPTLFNKTVYGEQFYDFNTGSEKSLFSLLEGCFDKQFLTRNYETLNKLLEKGVITTTMLRNFRENINVGGMPVAKIFDNYYDKALESVALPMNTYEIEVESKSVKEVISSFDVLSPPYFLDNKNAMGYYKENLEEYQKHYGEAIIEVRGIRDVQSWFLKKCGLNEERRGSYLTKPENIREEAIKLFTFLCNFTDPINDFEIFNLGMLFALRKY